jgi:hypothetical protein
LIAVTAEVSSRSILCVAVSTVDGVLGHEYSLSSSSNFRNDVVQLTARHIPSPSDCEIVVANSVFDCYYVYICAVEPKLDADAGVTDTTYAATHATAAASVSLLSASI